jgi:hypothetical protein
MEKSPESGMNIPDYFAESLETVIEVKILVNSLRRIGGGGGEGGLFDPRSGINIPISTLVTTSVPPCF